jgi:oxygen-independent coproporphyrinogen-3 oxidase
MSKREAGLYVHVPFCKTKCPYCDFYSITSLSMVEVWLRALQKEMNLYRNNFDTFDTLYIGGGTPTVLNDPAMISLFEELHNHFSFAQDTEITVEVNPDDITLKKLELLKSLGVNRLSIGVQSFNDEELKFLERRHTHQGAEKALHFINSAGLTNFGIDLMYGLPGQTERRWMTTLKKALTFRPTHLSCYELTIEKSTPFGRMAKEGTLETSSEEHGRNLFLLTSQFLEDKGFVHYEISNYSKGKEFRSRHNCKYWRHAPYLGLGPGAHSFQGIARWWNCRSVKDYCDKLQKGLRPIEGSESLSGEQLRLEKIFLGLRTKEGVRVEDAFPGFQTNGSLQKIAKTHLMTILSDRIIPTREGFLMADRLPLLFI